MHVRLRLRVQQAAKANSTKKHINVFRQRQQWGATAQNLARTREGESEIYGDIYIEYMIYIALFALALQSLTSMIPST